MEWFQEGIPEVNEPILAIQLDKAELTTKAYANLYTIEPFQM